MKRIFTFAFLATAILLIAGCDWTHRTTPVAEDPAPAPSALPRLLVVANPSLAEAIRREWRARTGDELLVAEMDEATWRQRIHSDDSLASDADAVIYPTLYLGHLAEARKILPAPDYLFQLDEDDRDILAKSDLLPGIRDVEVQWGGSWMAVPFSSAPLMLVYRMDILQQWSMEVPRTWSELREIATELHVRQRAGELPDSITGIVAQPLANGWAARNLLARVAASIRDPRKYSDVFTLTTMEPRIDSVPFVQALKQLISDQQFAADATERLTPDEVYAAVRGGSAVVGIGCWPVRLAGSEERSSPPLLGFALFPGSHERFDDGSGGWVEREGHVQVPLLAAGGYVGSVAQGTRRQRPAWNLLKQLTSPEWSSAIGPAGNLASPFRTSHLPAIQQWLEDDLADESLVQLRHGLQDYYAAPLTMSVLRIPNADEYLAWLDAAVVAALDGKETPEDALTHAAEQWSELLERDDRKRQSEAYLRGLSIHEH